MESATFLVASRQKYDLYDFEPMDCEALVFLMHRYCIVIL